MPQRSGTIRSGGRTEKNRRLVARAALDILVNGDVDLTIETLAQRSGVPKSTIYRRWPQRAMLIREALTEYRRDLNIDYSGPWDAYLHRTALTFRDFFSTPEEQALSALLASNRDADLISEVAISWAPLTDRLTQPLTHAIELGEIRSDVDPYVVISSILGTIICQITFVKDIPTDQFVKTLVDHFIISARASVA